MSNAKSTSDILPALPAPVATRRRARTIALWLLQVLVAFQFAGGGWLKLSGAPQMVEFSTRSGPVNGSASSSARSSSPAPSVW